MFAFASNLRSRASLLAAAVVMGASGLQAQQAAAPAPAQFDGKIELLELQTTLQVAHAKIQELEKQLTAAKEQNSALASAQATANAEATQLKESYEKLRGLLEGLGIGALENSTDQVQENLLKALSDLRIVDGQKKKVSEALVSLAEASMQFVKTAQSNDEAAKKALENALTNGDKVLRAGAVSGDDPTVTKSLHDAKVVSLKQELGVAVLDVGSRDGVKPGMPFEIYREDKPVARVLVTEVRKGVSGAVVQELMNAADPVKVGDRGKVDTNRTF